MKTKVQKTKAQREPSYRLEEQFVDDGTVAHALDLRDDGFGGTLAEQAWRRFRREVTSHPGRYAPDSVRRLVLLAKDGAR